MLSVIVYGRNDNHGYNMHKRIAISLNCIAEVLSDPDDEILYVDYNTSNDLPTVIEAIADTLTDKAKKLTRVFRVRPEIHDRYTDKTHAQVNEPLARNIALRRSNPNNRWILSSNTDMVFTILDEKKSLSDVVKEAEDGFYELARFDVPEPLWESLDRKNPQDIIAKFKKWGFSLHINEIVYGNETIIYDAPGDFQLALREDLFKIGGFDERMIWGWHVDSNLCKRMKLLRGEVKSLQDKLFGYHCNHTRSSGWMHSVKRKENSIETFFEYVTETTVPGHEESWGLAGEEVEEIRIGSDPTSTFIQKIDGMIAKPLTAPLEAFYNKTGYNEITYDTDHIFPYLAEQFVNLKQKSRIVYIGHNHLMLEKIENFISKLSNIEKIYYHQVLGLDAKNITTSAGSIILQPKKAEFLSEDEICKTVNMIIFDFGLETDVIKKISTLDSFRKLLEMQSCLLIKLALSPTKNRIKVLNIGVHNTQFYRNVKKFFNPIQNPFSSRIMVGFITNHNIFLQKFYEENYFRKAKKYLNLNRAIFSTFCLFTLLPVEIFKNKLRYTIKKISAQRKFKKAKDSLKKLQLNY
jgi:hypothetical protein